MEREIIRNDGFQNPCDNPIYRLILELMARGGMRVGEVLKLTPRDVHDRKLTLDLCQ